MAKLNFGVLLDGRSVSFFFMVEGFVFVFCH